MDLGLTGKCALVCAASKGLGKGCASALVREGVNVVIAAALAGPGLDATRVRVMRPARGSTGRTMGFTVRSRAGVFEQQPAGGLAMQPCQLGVRPQLDVGRGLDAIDQVARHAGREAGAAHEHVNA